MADEEPTDENVQEVVDEGHDFLLRLIGVRAPDDPYFEKIDVEVPKGKLVALDAAVMTAHLLVAIVMFKSLSELFSEKILAMEKGVAAWAGKAGSFLIKKIGAFIRLISVFGDLWKQEETGRKMESKIRKASATVRKQLVEIALTQVPKRRVTRLVRSRHKSPTQRKENESWQTKKPRNR